MPPRTSKMPEMKAPATISIAKRLARNLNLLMVFPVRSRHHACDEGNSRSRASSPQRRIADRNGDIFTPHTPAAGAAGSIGIPGGPATAKSLCYCCRRSATQPTAMRSGSSSPCLGHSVATTVARYLRPMSGRSSSTLRTKANAHSSRDMAGASGVVGFVLRAMIHDAAPA